MALYGQHESTLGLITKAASYQFYTLLVVLSVPILSLLAHDFSGQRSVFSSEPTPQIQTNYTTIQLLLPLLLLLGGMVLLALWTGNGNLVEGNIGVAIIGGCLIAIVGSGWLIIMQALLSPSL